MHIRTGFLSKIKKIKNAICQDNSQFYDLPLLWLFSVHTHFHAYWQNTSSTVEEGETTKKATISGCLISFPFTERSSTYKPNL